MPEKSKPSFLKVLIQLIILIGVLGLLLFLPAGRLDWLQAWAFIIFITIYFLLYIYFGIYKDPEQTRERSRIGENVKPWDKVILRIYTALLPTVFILAGLDVGRFGLSNVPVFLQVLAWLGLVFSGAIILWTVTTNTYLSRYARIQDDRGQEVIISGPYHHVRHPMYLGIIILFLCIRPALGSLLALIPGFLIAVLFAIRTAKEDNMLQEELSGYKAYSQKVPYRLLPGIW
jgi:protein-S-isoprenylcysteine O-methyltransferase Ste14